MQEPPEYWLPFMHNLETTVLAIWSEFSFLSDKDVEFAYEKLKIYYRKVSQGKSPEEPETTSERRQILMDELLNMIEIREEENIDSFFINHPDYAPTGKPIPNLAAFYVMALNRLIKSVRMWRKRSGPKGDLSFIRDHVV